MYDMNFDPPEGHQPLVLHVNNHWFNPLVVDIVISDR